MSVKHGEFVVERDHGPPAEGSASFHTSRWTIVMKAAQSQTPGGRFALAQFCCNYGLCDALIASEGRLSP
jgi:hypothetical protein